MYVLDFSNAEDSISVTESDKMKINKILLIIKYSAVCSTRQIKLTSMNWGSIFPNQFIVGPFDHKQLKYLHEYSRKDDKFNKILLIPNLQGKF